MFADENLRGEDRELGRTALGNEHDVEQGICDAGFRRDRDPARDVAAIRDMAVATGLGPSGFAQRSDRCVPPLSSGVNSAVCRTMAPIGNRMCQVT